MNIYGNKFINLELLNEADVMNSISGNLVEFYNHMLKYLYKSNKQTASWVNTIQRTSKEVCENLNNSIINKLNEDKMKKIFNDGRKLAAKECKTSTDDFPKEIPTGWDNIKKGPNSILSTENLKKILINNINYETNPYPLNKEKVLSYFKKDRPSWDDTKDNSYDDPEIEFINGGNQ